MNLSGSPAAYSREAWQPILNELRREDARNVKADVAIKNGLTLREWFDAQSAVNVKEFGYGLGGGTADDTVAAQAAIDYCYTNNLGTVFFPPGTYAATTLVRNFASSGKSVNIVGAGTKSTAFVKYGAGTAPIFDWSADSDVLTTYSSFRDFSIAGTAKAFHGIRITRCGRFVMDNVYISACDRAIDNVGSLIWTGRNLALVANNYGLITRKSGSIYCNLVTLRDSQIISNSIFGADIGDAVASKLINCDIENNGTAADTATGGIVFRDTCDDEAGVTMIVARDLWFESGQGWDLTVEGMANAVVSLDTVLHFGPESGRAIRILGGRAVKIESSLAAAVGDKIEVSGVDKLTIDNSYFHTIIETATDVIGHGTTQGAATFTKSKNNYNSGSFTGLAKGSTAAGAGTYTGQSGRWERDGRKMYFTLHIGWSAHTGTGNINIDLNDIPLASANNGVATPVTILPSNLTFAGQLIGELAINSKIIDVQVVATGVAAASVAMDTAADLTITGSYLVTDS